ncbi:inorganic phosphate transporter [Exiguobacterium sp. SL14]|nr:inorganic phosphate transporter [Exiguobacterium sp. SL14]MCY1689638.1 inorganic phosphate transporter [Exiguobacterium sp. SL14]
MDSLFIITAIIVILALSFDFINGFHDTANSIATAVSTRALKPRHAIVLAKIDELPRCDHVHWSRKNDFGDIVDPSTLEHGSYVVIVALLSAIAWNLLTWYFGIPSSSSHTLIGSIA